MSIRYLVQNNTRTYFSSALISLAPGQSVTLTSLPAALAGSDLVNVLPLLSNPISSAVVDATGELLTVTFRSGITASSNPKQGFVYSRGTIASGSLNTGTVELVIPTLYDGQTASIQYDGETGTLFAAAGAVDSSASVAVTNNSTQQATIVGAEILADGGTLRVELSADYISGTDAGFSFDPDVDALASASGVYLDFSLSTIIFSGDDPGTLDYDTGTGDLLTTNGTVATAAGVVIVNNSELLP